MKASLSRARRTYVHAQGKGIFYGLVSDGVYLTLLGNIMGLIQALGTDAR